MAITQISNNVILDGTILPAKLNVSANMRTFLGNATSANLASAVSGTTGSGNLVFAISPTLTTPTISRSGSGTVVTFSDGTGRNAIFETATFGMQMTINATGGTLGAYNTLNGQFEAWCNVIANSNTTGLRYMRFGNRQDRFSVQRLNDAGSSITSTPFSFANNAPSNSFYMESDGRIGFGTATPNASAIIDLTSTSQGFLPPRMTSTQRNAISGASVPSGLTVFNSTDNALSVYTTVLSSWDNVFTTRSGSFTSATLANAVSEGATGSGQLVLAINPTFQGANVTGNLAVTAHFSAATKSFKIPHQTKGGYLQYGVVESNEHSVYVRGKTNSNIIQLPDHWDWLVDSDSVTTQLTPIGHFQPLFVANYDNKTVTVGGVEGLYSYVVYGTRKDVAPLEVEVE